MKLLITTAVLLSTLAVVLSQEQNPNNNNNNNNNNSNNNINNNNPAGLYRRVRKMKLAAAERRQDDIIDEEDFAAPLPLRKKRPSKVPPVSFNKADFKTDSATEDNNGLRKIKHRRKKVPSSASTLHPSSSLNVPPTAEVITATEKTIVLPTKQQLQEQKAMEEAKNRTAEEKRFLSLFTIVSFQNGACQSSFGTNGTCYSASECTTLGGRSSGACASGFGVCCMFFATCGQTISTNCTYFHGTGYPSTFNAVGSCQLTVNKINSNVCQLRLDFENFVLAPPETTDNKCQTDQFVVTGGPNIPAICGTNTGQHIYVDTGLATNAQVVLTAVTGSNTFDRSLSIKVCQIECDSLSKASDGCLQYFTGVSGQIQSFNYVNAAGLQLSNTDYAVCVRMERNFCGIQYNACPDPLNNVTAMSFSITGAITSAQGSMVGTNCNTDWITIPCATNTNNPVAQSGTPTVCVDRICGMVFNSVTANAGTKSVPVNSYMKPFNIFVHTDATEGSASPAQTGNRGFCLNYVQQPCTSNAG